MLVRRVQKRQTGSLRKVAELQSSSGFLPEQSETSALRQESIEQVRKAIDQLSPEQQQVVRLRIYEDRKFAEIADELAIPLGTVLTRMRAATQKLQKALGRHFQ